MLHILLLYLTFGVNYRIKNVISTTWTLTVDKIADKESDILFITFHLSLD